MLATVTGIVTAILLIFVMIPPLRLTSVDKMVGGLSIPFRLHHTVGIVVLFVGAVHAVAAMYPYLVSAESLKEVIGMFLDPSDSVVFLGTAAWLFLTPAVVTSLWPNMRRTPWLWLHRLSVIGFALALAHVALAWGNILSFQQGVVDAGRLAIAVLAIFVSIGVGLHYVYPEALGTHRAFIVTAVNPLDQDVVELSLKPGKGRGVWRAGEFGYFRFDCQGPCGVTKERHPFTVIRMTGSGEMKVAIKAVGDDTTKLQRIHVGTRGEVTGPYGSFEALLLHANPQLWIAGGLGMMPFLGLVQRLDERSEKSGDIALIYLYRPGREPLYLEELRQLASSDPCLRVVPIEVPAGEEIGPDEIEAFVPDWRQRDIGLAGSHAMVEHWISGLQERGFPQSRIYVEDFTK